MSQKIIGSNPFNWSSSPEWVNQDDSHCSIINKSNNDVFTDLTIMKHTNSKKRIGQTKVQNLSSRINSESGLLETKGELIDKMRKNMLVPNTIVSRAQVINILVNEKAKKLNGRVDKK